MFEVSFLLSATFEYERERTVSLPYYTRQRDGVYDTVVDAYVALSAAYGYCSSS